MKRIILMVILLFPVVTLAAWLYWGSRPAQRISNEPVTTNAPTAAPNSPLPSPAKP